MESSKGRCRDDVLNICLHAIHAGNTARTRSVGQKQVPIQAELSKVAKAKAEPKRKLGLQPS